MTHCSNTGVVSSNGIYKGAYFRILLEQAGELSLGLSMCTRLEGLGKTLALTLFVNPFNFARSFFGPLAFIDPSQ